MEKKLICSYPATVWNDTTPLGNGRLGASVYGAVYDERILINHEALFNWLSPDAKVPDVSYALKEVRALMDDGKYKEANEYYTNLLKDKNYNTGKAKFHPMMDLHLVVSSAVAPENYSRELDMENGVCTISYTEDGKKCTRTILASQVNGAVVVNIKKEESFDLTLSLEQHDLADYADRELYHTFTSYADKNYIFAECTTLGKLHYSGALKVLECDGEIQAGKSERARKIDMAGEARLSNFIKIKGAKNVTILIDAESIFAPFEEMKAKLDKISGDFNTMLKEHQESFSKLFNKTKITIDQNEQNASNESLLMSSYSGKVDGRITQKMADFGRYLLISSSYGCALPANLQGLWNGDYSPAWACTYFNNENIQMAYWQAYAGGLADTVLPLFNLYDKFKDDYRDNAKMLYGCRGILLPLFMDNSNGRKENLQPHVIYWTGSSAWISAIYYDYYLFTGDKKFLLERAYPFMKEACLFYEDFMVEDEGGRLKSYPSNSPENRANGDFDGAGELSVSINSTMDFALLKELLTNLISASKELGIDNEKREQWRKMLSKIPEYEINEDGAMREWLHPDFKDNYHHRHQSHIYPLFPGFEITEENNKEIFDAIKVAVEKRLCIGLKEQTGWSFAHMANIFARLGNGKKAKECLDLLVRFCTGTNLYTYHNDWRNMGVTLKYMHSGHAPFQIDANMGFTGAVYEMLLYSDTDKIKVLPAIPNEWEAGKVEGVFARGGFVLSYEWSKNEISVEITATRDAKTNLSLVGYAPQGKHEKSIYDGFVALDMKKGESIKLKGIRK
ncbi:MAG: glycoside hydrolase family 95 protein [Clostridia bacterium]|nr:glycoside hydrolase family 95 protein [Clostridia bacterium]